MRNVYDCLLTPNGISLSQAQYRRMKTGFIAYFRVFTVALWLSLSSLSAAPFLQPNPEVDLNLFALRLLENLRLPELDDSYEQTLGEHQRTLIEYREFFAAKGVDEQIVVRFDSAVELSKALQEVIRRGLEIEQSAKDQQHGTLVSQAVASSKTALRVGVVVQEPVTAIVAGGGHYIWNIVQQFKAANRAKDSLLDSELSKFMALFNECTAKNKATAGLMTDKYGWKPGEAGFTTSVEDRQKMDALYQAGDLAALEQLTSFNLKTRPRDPFAINDAAVIRFRAGVQSESVAEMLQVADMIIEAANLFPSATAFSEHRASMLFSAAYAQTLNLFFQSRADFQGAEESSVKKALQLLEESRNSSHSSPGSAFFELLSNAAGYAGAYKDALEAADRAYADAQGGPSFHLNCARLASRAGEHDRALSELRKALLLGALDLQLVKESPDLAALQANRSKEWNDLFEVKYTWDVDWGFFNDDVLLRNDSEFTLTEVVFAPKITTDGKVYAPILKADFIPPGKVYRWSNAFSIPGSKADESESRLACAESEANQDLKK